MIKKDKNEIEERVKEIWSDPYGDPEFEITINSEDVQIKIWDEYESPSLNLEKLMALADFFGTKNINDDERFAERGCDTCDYGSEYGFVLTVRPEKDKDYE